MGDSLQLAHNTEYLSNRPQNWCRVEIVLDNGALIAFEADIVEDECLFVKDVLYFHKFGKKPTLNGVQSGRIVYKFEGNPLAQKKGTSLSIDISKVSAVLFHQLSDLKIT